jgi:hypothetical protein
MVNIIPEDIYQLIFEDPQHKLQEKSNTQLIMFNKSVMTAVSKLSIPAMNPKNRESYKLEYLIVYQDLHSCLVPLYHPATQSHDDQH